MPELINAKKERIARTFTSCLDWYETIRLCGLSPEVGTDASQEDIRIANQKVSGMIYRYRNDPQITARIVELQESQQEIKVSKQQLIAARLAVAQAALQGNDRYGYNAKAGRFEVTGEKIIDYKAADGALAGVAKMLGLDQQIDDGKNLVVVLPGSLLESSEKSDE